MASIDAKRRTSSTVDHRRPFWAKTEKSHQIYLDNPRKVTIPGDHGVDNFSYDNAHIKQWLMPADLAKRLPKELLAWVEDWQKAGAALCTALDRIQELYNNAMSHAYPDKSRNPLARRGSSQQQAVVGAESPTSIAPLSPTPTYPANPILLDKAALMNLLQQQQQQQRPAKQIMGMETPPFSPVDSVTCATPVSYDQKTKDVLPDLARINSQLSPLNIPEALTPVSPIGFDENSWEYYLKRFKQEKKDNKECLSRIKGYGKRIDILHLELSRELKPEILLAVMDFGKWWQSAKPKVSKYEERVKSLAKPKLAYVNIEWDMIRARQLGQAHSGVLESA